MSYNGSESSEELRVLVIGKAGNGKSSLCNAIVGENRFKVGRGMSTTTLTAQSETVKGNMRIKVVDTPDITNSGLDAQHRREEIAKWRQLTLPHPSIVLLTIRCDVRYTAEEYAIYQEILTLWGNSLKDRLVVAFTFEDCQDTPIEEELPGVCDELKAVLRDARNTYITFNKTSKESCRKLTDRILDVVVQRKKGGAERKKGGAERKKGDAERKKEGAERKKEGAEREKGGAGSNSVEGAERKKEGAERKKGAAGSNSLPEIYLLVALWLIAVAGIIAYVILDINWAAIFFGVCAFVILLVFGVCLRRWGWC